MKGKIAYLCYYDGDLEIHLTEPDKWIYTQVIKIVYFEVA